MLRTEKYLEIKEIQFFFKKYAFLIKKISFVCVHDESPSEYSGMRSRE